MKVSDNTNIQLPLRNLISIIAGVAVAVWAYFGIIERLNTIETNGKLMIVDVEKNTEFRIKWPRGEMGSLPADSEQFLLIEDSIVDIEKLTTRVDDMMNNKVNIERLIKDVDKLTESLEKLKDKVRANGSHQ
jgi:dephospho-CoA kinase|tara:strand:+ start:96 stop:491 length:396 start_codon:yes stop_codon:yes gene_type:complete